MARETETKLNREVIRQALLGALKYSYFQYKDSQARELKATFIGDKGQLCWLGDPSYYVQQIWNATEEYNRSRKRYDDYVKLVESDATDEELTEFLNKEEET